MAAATWWGASAGLCMAGTAVLKVSFVMCPPLTELHSPSGHTSLSTLVYGSLVLLIATAVDGRWRHAAIGGGSALVLGIAFSRVALHTHTVLETLLGLAIGAAALGLFAGHYLVKWRTPVALRQLLLSVAVLIVLLHGQQLHAEDLLRAVGSYLQNTTGITCE
jgi:membrane-associated phospholipid phosphatase